MLVALQWISGVMVGLEVQWGHCVIVDLGIVRVVFVYNTEEDED